MHAGIVKTMMYGISFFVAVQVTFVMLLISMETGHGYITDLTIVDGEDAATKGFAVIHSPLNEGIAIEELTVKPKKSTFEEAEKSCEELENGRLVVIRDQKMQDKVEETIVESGINEPSVWIGMNGTGDKANNQYSFQWLDGTPYETGTSFSNFHPTDPNDDGVLCIFVATGKLVVKKGKWMDGNCQLKKPYMCEYLVKGKNRYLAVKYGTTTTDAITDIKILNGNETSAPTPPGYELIKTNLYTKSSGDFLYAAYTRDASKGDPIDQVSVLTCHIDNEHCNCFDVNKYKIAVNLSNKPGGNFVFLCYRRANQTISR